MFPVLRLAMVHFFFEPLRVRGIHHSPLCLNTSMCIPKKWDILLCSQSADF